MNPEQMRLPSAADLFVQICPRRTLSYRSLISLANKSIRGRAV